MTLVTRGKMSFLFVCLFCFVLFRVMYVIRLHG